jgi:hypothetical protein
MLFALRAVRFALLSEHIIMKMQLGKMSASVGPTPQVVARLAVPGGLCFAPLWVVNRPVAYGHERSLGMTGCLD